MPGARTYRGEPSRPIPVWNGVLEHRDRIGEALWEFLWCLDRITLERNGIGLVFGGTPVKLERIVADLKGGKETVRRHLGKLVDGKYIRMRRTPYGQVIEVLNSKKFGIWGKEKPQSDVSPPGVKPIGEPEKPTGGSEKPQSDVSKEDHARTMQEAAAEKPAAAASTDLEPWKAIGLDRPTGSLEDRATWEACYAQRNGHPLSHTLGQFLDELQNTGKPIPKPFAQAIAHLRAQEQPEPRYAVGPRRPAVIL